MIEPDAWIITCKKPGNVSVFLDFEENSTQHWPTDQWTEITKTPLYDLTQTDEKDSEHYSLHDLQLWGESMTPQHKIGKALLGYAETWRKQLAHMNTEIKGMEGLLREAKGALMGDFEVNPNDVLHRISAILKSNLG